MQLGKSVDVSANGSGLVTAAAAGSEAASSEPAASSSDSSGIDAGGGKGSRVQEIAGLPVPTPNTLNGSSEVAYRLQVNARVPASAEAVLAFIAASLPSCGCRSCCRCSRPASSICGSASRTGRLSGRPDAESRRSTLNVLLAVPLFILTANIMNVSTISDRLWTFANTIVGRLPGGHGHVTVLTNLIMSSMTGSAASDAAGAGMVAIRMMRTQGWLSRRAGRGGRDRRHRCWDR